MQLVVVKSVNAVDNNLLTHKMTMAERIRYLKNIGNILSGYLFRPGKPVLADKVIDDSVNVLCRTVTGWLGSDF